MKLFARPKCFSEALRLVTILSCLLGFHAFEYPRGYPRPILSFIYLLFIYCIFYSGSFRMQEKFFANNVKLLRMEHVLYQLMLYIFIVSIIFKMFLGWWHTKKFTDCYKKIFEIDKTLRQLGLSVNYDRLYFVTIGIITVWITTGLVICIMIFVQLQIHTNIFTSIYIILVYTYGFITIGINTIEFCIFVKCLEVKFKLVNQLLCESLTNLSTKEIKLSIFKLKDYAKTMNTEKRKHIFSMKMIFRRRRRVTRINVSVPKKQDQIISQIESHFPSQLKKELQNEFQNRFRKYNSVETKYQERKHLLQTLKIPLKRKYKTDLEKNYIREVSLYKQTFKEVIKEEVIKNYSFMQLQERVHLELCKISKIVCTTFGIQTAWDVGEIIMVVTGALYNLYVRFIIQQYKVKSWTNQITFVLAMCFLCIMKAISLSCICKNAAVEGNKTIEIIRAINECDGNTDMQEEIQQFGAQILQSPVTFSVFGLTINYRILTMILGTVATDLVIMIQMSNTLELNNAIQKSFSMIKVYALVHVCEMKFMPRTKNIV